jgi:hypothetical protein
MTKKFARTKRCGHVWVATTTHPYYRCECGVYGLRAPRTGVVKALSEYWHHQYSGVFVPALPERPFPVLHEERGKK